MSNCHVQGDGEQLHPDLQRILELELNDYHFLRLGLEFFYIKLWKSMVVSFGHGLYMSL